MNERSQSDPLSLAAQVGHIQFTPLDLTSSPEAMAASITERRDQARTAAAIYGVEPKFLTNEEASVFSSLLKTQDRMGRMQFLGTMAQHFGNDAPEVLAQIAPKQPELAHIGGLLMMDRGDTVNQALEGLDLIKEGNKAVGFTPSNTQGAFSSTVGSSLMYQSGSRADGFAVAEAIYTSMSFDKGLDDFDEGLWTTAIQLAFGHNYQQGTGGFQEVRGEVVLLPPQLNAEDMEDMFDAITVGTLSENTGGIINPDLAKQIQGNDDFYPVVFEDGKYYIVIGDPGTDDFRYMTDMVGTPLVLDALKFYGYRE